MSKARGKIESFEPANVSGLDTRIWQGKGTATDINGVVFSLQGEIVKVPGLKKLLTWERVPPQQGDDGQTLVDKNQVRSGTVSVLAAAGSYLSGEEINPLKHRKVLGLGTFTWGSSTELIVVSYEDSIRSFGRFAATLGPNTGNTVFISVMETNKLRTIYSYKVGDEEPEARYYPRLVDVGPYLLITVEGRRPVKWDGRLISFAGIYELPPPPQAALLVGTGDNIEATEDNTPNTVGDFWDEHSLDQDDATGVSMTYYQTYVNSFGQESNLSAPSNDIRLSDLLQVREAKSNNATATYGGYGSWAAWNAIQPGSMPAISGLTPGSPSGPVGGATTTSITSPTGTHGTTGTTTTDNSRRGITSKYKRLAPFLMLGDPPTTLDITHRILYRSIGGQTPVSLPRFLGVGSQTHFDIRKVGASSVDPAPSPGQNDPPPPARWAFPFRGRVYYRGDKATLHYSRLNFPEAVSAMNFIEINTADGEDITAWGAAQDYAVIFKMSSAYLLTHDKKEEPIITPLQSTFGAISDRSVVSFDNRTYFLSDIGFHMFDGAKFHRISSVLDEKVRQLPDHTRDRAVVFSDKRNNRIYIAVNANPGLDNNEIWVIHTDTGSFTIIKDRKILAAVNIKGETVVAVDKSRKVMGASPAYSGAKGSPVSTTTFLANSSDLYLWGRGYDVDGAGFTGSYSTEWIELKNPHSDKRFYKLLLYFIQTGDITMNVSWHLNWDNSAAAGSTTLSLKDNDPLLWDASSTTWDAASAVWDERRLVSKFVDLPEVSGATEQTITGKAVRFTFDTSATNSPFRLVGWQLVADDYGERAEGTASR